MRLSLVLLAALAGCFSPPLPAPAQPPAVPPTGSNVSLVPRVPRPPDHYQSSWSALPDGSEPPEFADVAAESGPRIWLYSGDWAIARDGGQAVYAVSANTDSYPEPLTFRRYRGAIFGPDGTLPARYSVRAEGRSTGGSKRFNGVGELAMQVVFGDTTHYLEILQNDTATNVWWADGAVPQSTGGWHNLASWPLSYSAGQWLDFGADVDLRAGVLTAWRQGSELGQVQIPDSFAGVRPRMCLRATGNGEEWRSLSIRRLAAGGTPAAPG